jgi:hypothetical protein
MRTIMRFRGYYSKSTIPLGPTDCIANGQITEIFSTSELLSHSTRHRTRGYTYFLLKTCRLLILRTFCSDGGCSTFFRCSDRRREGSQLHHDHDSTTTHCPSRPHGSLVRDLLQPVRGRSQDRPIPPHTVVLRPHSLLVVSDPSDQRRQSAVRLTTITLLILFANSTMQMSV